MEEITRDRFTLADLFHETRATYRKRVIKTVLRDSLYNTKRYRSCYFSTIRVVSIVALGSGALMDLNSYRPSLHFQ